MMTTLTALTALRVRVVIYYNLRVGFLFVSFTVNSKRLVFFSFVFLFSTEDELAEALVEIFAFFRLHVFETG
jgi:hypothetical protein